MGFILPFLIILTYLIFKKDIKVLKETTPGLEEYYLPSLYLHGSIWQVSMAVKSTPIKFFSNKMPEDSPVRLHINVRFIITS